MRDNRRSRLVVLGLLTVAFALLTVDARAGSDSPLAGARGVASAIFGPVEHGTTAMVDPVANWVDSLSQAHQDHAAVGRLEADNARLRAQLEGLAQNQTRQNEVDKLLHIAGLGQYTIVPAQVIGIGAAQGFTWTVTIDAGSSDGINTDETVINGDGLVGRVVTVGPSESTVLLAIDPGFSVGSRMEKTMEAGLTQGQGNQPLRLTLLNGQAQVKPGDRLVTMGSQQARPFVPGVPVGTIKSVVPTPGELTRTALVTPFVDFTALDIVGVVVQPPRADPRDALLPPVPAAPAPAASVPAPTSTASPSPGRGGGVEPSAGPSPSAGTEPSTPVSVTTRPRRH